MDLFNTRSVTFEQPTAMLRACHGKVKRFCSQLHALPDYLQQHGYNTVAEQAVAQIRHYFNVAAPLHHQDEEEDFFPLLLQYAPEAKALIQELENEHQSLHGSWDLLNRHLASLTDGTPLPIGLDFTAATVTYERNFNGAQKATLCLPYDLYAQGFKAYTLSGGNKNEVHFKEVDDKLPAYTPYYITANGMPQLGGRNIEVKAYTGANLTTSANGYSIKGTVVSMDNATAAAANAYILQDDGKFHKVTTTNSAATIPAYRAYIICPPQASGAKQLSVVLDGETTGIGSTTNEATDGKNGPVYDLQGRRVADRLDDARHRLPAGVYIVGGRKVVVK